MLVLSELRRMAEGRQLPGLQSEGSLDAFDRDVAKAVNVLNGMKAKLAQQFGALSGTKWDAQEAFVSTRTRPSAFMSFAANTVANGVATMDRVMLSFTPYQSGSGSTVFDYNAEVSRTVRNLKAGQDSDVEMEETVRYGDMTFDTMKLATIVGATRKFWDKAAKLVPKGTKSEGRAFAHGTVREWKRGKVMKTEKAWNRIAREKAATYQPVPEYGETPFGGDPYGPMTDYPVSTALEAIAAKLRGDQ